MKLPIVQPVRSARSSAVRHWCVHLARWALLVVIVLAIRERHARFVVDERGRREITASLEQVRDLLPTAAEFGPSDSQKGGRYVVDGDGETIGYVVQTLPAARSIIGYAGPNDVLLAFTAAGRLAGLKLLSSGDTPDHVAMVRRDQAFLTGFDGRTWDELAAIDNVDGVAGATLTSAAIAESIVLRLDGSQPSFRFPEPLDIAAAQAFFPAATTLDAGPRGSVRAVDAGGTTLGLLLRSSPASDQRLGYQGPIDGLLALDPAGATVVGFGIHRSYDTDRYVEDVTLDWTFMHRFDGMPLDEFVKTTVGHARDVEGVSGATMTSQTLVENLVDAAGRFLTVPHAAPPSQRAEAGLKSIRWAVRDVGTIVVVLLAGVIAFTNLRGKPWLRRMWQVVLIGYLGFVNADLLSQATLVGWARHGLPWSIAPGLVFLALAAFAVPLTSRTQLYCHQLCPHGAAQELLRNRLLWRVRIPRRLEPWLACLPGVLLACVAVVALWHLPVDLTGLEPFDAYALKATVSATVVVAVVSLAASLFVPMAYCRYGCPTGGLLSYLRRNARSDRLTRGDALAVVLATVAVWLAWL